MVECTGEEGIPLGNRNFLFQMVLLLKLADNNESRDSGQYSHGNDADHHDNSHAGFSQAGKILEKPENRNAEKKNASNVD